MSSFPYTLRFLFPFFLSYYSYYQLTANYPPRKLRASHARPLQQNHDVTVQVQGGGFCSISEHLRLRLNDNERIVSPTNRKRIRYSLCEHADVCDLIISALYIF